MRMICRHEKPHFCRSSDFLHSVCQCFFEALVFEQARLDLVKEVEAMAKSLALTNSVNKMLARKKRAEVSQVRLMLKRGFKCFACRQALNRWVQTLLDGKRLQALDHDPSLLSRMP